MKIMNVRQILHLAWMLFGCGWFVLLPMIFMFGWGINQLLPAVGILASVSMVIAVTCYAISKYKIVKKDGEYRGK